MTASRGTTATVFKTGEFNMSKEAKTDCISAHMVGDAMPSEVLEKDSEQKNKNTNQSLEKKKSKPNSENLGNGQQKATENPNDTHTDTSQELHKSTGDQYDPCTGQERPHGTPDCKPTPHDDDPCKNRVDSSISDACTTESNDMREEDRLVDTDKEQITEIEPIKSNESEDVSKESTHQEKRFSQPEITQSTDCNYGKSGLKNGSQSDDDPIYVKETSTSQKFVKQDRREKVSQSENAESTPAVGHYTDFDKDDQSWKWKKDFDKDDQSWKWKEKKETVNMVNKNVNNYVLWQDRSFWAYIVIHGILTSVLIGFVINFYQQPPTNIIDSKGKDIGPLFEEIHFKMDKQKRIWEEKMDTLQKENNELKTKVTDMKTFIEYLEEKVPKLDGKLNWMEKEHSEINSYIIGFLFLIVVGLLGAAYRILFGKVSSRNWDQLSSSGQGVSSNRISGVSTKPSSILDQINQKPLLNNIGMVGFNKETQRLHKQLVHAVKEHSEKQTEVKCFVVQSTDDIHQIPASKIVFIFVDFNDRNIILEDPETEIGDIRRMTTECIMKMGCSVFVVYVRDVYSKSLPDNELYNSGLHSITRHKLLSKLQRNNRVLSVDTAFNMYQLESISKVLREHLS